MNKSTVFWTVFLPLIIVIIIWAGILYNASAEILGTEKIYFENEILYIIAVTNENDFPDYCPKGNDYCMIILPTQPVVTIVFLSMEAIGYTEENA